MYGQKLLFSGTKITGNYSKYDKKADDRKLPIGCNSPPVIFLESNSGLQFLGNEVWFEI